VDPTADEEQMIDGVLTVVYGPDGSIYHQSQVTLKTSYYAIAFFF
jgi:exosome complex RNA-binding protein Rrp42 (RNase PH superfamily)